MGGSSLVLLLAAATLCSRLVAGFWFTENTFTYQPAQVAKEAGERPRNSSGSLEVLTKTEPWIRVDQANEQQQQCQCNLDWLQNQTSLWLGKWLDKAQAQVAASVARARLSNSTGAGGNINRRPAAGNHWGAWVSRPRQKNGPSKEQPQQQQQQQHQREREQRQLAQGPRGPPGSPGPPGPKGERGPPGAGLLRVPDRDALFDLAGPNHSALVFMEAEQALVVATQSGWRPLQLGGALRDFRRALARFGVPAGERRLAGADNLIGGRPPARLANDEDEDVEDAEDVDEDVDDEEDEEDEDEEDGEDEEEEEEEEEEANELPDKRSASALVAASMSAPALIGPLPAPVAASLVAPSLNPAPASSTEATPSRRPKLRVAALNEPFSGNLHGIRGADFECRRQAAKAELRGSFRALLASSSQSLNEIVRHSSAHKFPVVNLRDEILANSWLELLRQPVRLANPLSRVYSFSGRHVASHANWPNKLVWHGAANRLGQRDPLHNCDGWHSDSLAKFAWASPIHAPRNSKRKGQKRKRSANNSTSGQLDNHLLEAIDKYPCRMPLVVLCVETVAQLAPAEPQSRASNQINQN